MQFLAGQVGAVKGEGNVLVQPVTQLDQPVQRELLQVSALQVRYVRLLELQRLSRSLLRPAYGKYTTYNVIRYTPRVIVSFADSGTHDVFNGADTRSARKVCPSELWRVAHRKLDMLNASTRLEDLRAPPTNRLETLKGDRAGQYSIRINDQYRVCFVWNAGNAEQVQIVDYH